ncbi:TIGR04255 family protein [Candidatus Methanoprimaticola sp. MG2]|uniref:TIGR04255 family protein n=1 Tax=Candidatus Methanoprimaticola sp. MG2 TaxID=3228838 RepID=UPI0039C65850
MNRERILHKNQIDVVVCQIGFNVIFGIDERMGAIQEDLRSRYPFSSISVEGEPLPSPGISPINNYCFESDDRRWKVNITRGFLSISTCAYQNWDDFKDRLHDVMDIVCKHLKLDSTTRIGLRYINTIRRSRLATYPSDLPEWSDLIDVHTLGLMGVHANSTNTYSSRIEYEYKESKCCTTSGQIRFNDDGEVGFLIDNDVFTDKGENVDDVFNILDKFNNICYELFESMITDKLMEMMR